MKKVFIKLLLSISILSLAFGVNIVSAEETQLDVGEWLISNPTKDLERGVISSKALPTIKHLTKDNSGQIWNVLGIQAGQYLVTFIILSMLKLIGVAALIGIIFNAFVLVTYAAEEEKHEKAAKGLKWSIFAPKNYQNFAIFGQITLSDE